MPAESNSPSERIVAAFAKLTESARNINAVSDELAKPIAAIEASLKRLNVGVACWTKINGGSDGYAFWSHDVGYLRVKGEWCLAIQTSKGPEHSPEESIDEVWPFNEAPRYLRVQAVDKLPELIEALVEAADATAKRLKEKVAPAQELAAAINPAIHSKKK